MTDKEQPGHRFDPGTFASVGVSPAERLLAALREAQEVLGRQPDGTEGAAPKMLRRISDALAERKKKDAAEDPLPEHLARLPALSADNCDTVMAFSKPDEAATFESAFRGEFQADFDYFSAIQDSRHRHTIESIAKRAHGMVSQLDFGVLQNGIAWCWVKLKQDIADVVQRFAMNKLSRGCSLYGDFFEHHLVLCWTYNGSIVALIPGAKDLDLVYEAISLRPEFLAQRSTDALMPSARFSGVRLHHPVQVGGKIHSSAIVSSRVRAIYWVADGGARQGERFASEVSDVASAFGDRSSQLIRMSEQHLSGNGKRGRPLE